MLWILVKMCLIPATDNSNMEPQCNLECNYLTIHDYVDLLWTTLAEFPGDMKLFSPLMLLFLVNQPKCKHCYMSYIYKRIDTCVICVLMSEQVFWSPCGWLIELVGKKAWQFVFYCSLCLFCHCMPAHIGTFIKKPVQILIRMQK